MTTNCSADASAFAVRIDVPEGLEPDAILGSLAAHTIPGAERTDVEARAHTRLLAGPHGLRAVTLRIDRHGIDLCTEPLVAGDRPEHELRTVAAIVRRWFDLYSDLGPVREALGRDPVLAPLISDRPGLRVIGTPDRFQSAVTTVLGQQVSLAVGRTFAGRLVAMYGRDGPSGLRSFPDASTLAKADAEELRAAVGLTSARARTVLALAQTWVNLSSAPSRRDLLGIPGVGPWTVDYLGVRYGDRDAFTPGDLVLRRALGGITSAEAEGRAEVWRPFRAYALAHLWTEAAYVARPNAVSPNKAGPNTASHNTARPDTPMRPARATVARPRQSQTEAELKLDPSNGPVWTPGTIPVE